MTFHMNGFASHALAAVMTFTVLTFPTPSDLMRAIRAETSPTPLGSLPTLEGISPPKDVALSVSKLYPAIASCVPVDGKLGELSTACMEALDAIQDPSARDPFIRITQDPKAAELAVSFYCRSLWAEKTRRGESFDASGCLAPLSALADATE